jgi:hypothetical protein
MSLTSAIANRASPFSAFLEAELPKVRDLSAAFRAVRPPDGDALRPTAPEGVEPAWGTIGAAIDHRLRYAFADHGQPSESVEAGIQAAPYLAPAGARYVIRQAGDELVEALHAMVAQRCPSDRTRPMLLSAAAEDELARICYVMAWFEEARRSGRLWPGTPLGDAGPDLVFDQMLAAVPDYAVADMAAQVQLADSALSALRAACPPSRVHTGPVFAGSPDVGGADADMIIGDLLVDTKALAAPSRISRRDFYQLIGYALLDYDDQFGIDRIGFYLSRFGQLITWQVAEYLTLLGSQRPLTDLRKRCAAVLSTA